VVLEVPAPQDGVLEKILVDDGSTVVADQVIGMISASGSLGQVADKAEEDVVELKAAVGADNVPAPGPAARRLLAEYDIDPRHLSGSGRSGRITKADVLAGITQVQAAAQSEVAPPPAPEPAAGTVAPAPVPSIPEFGEDRPQQRVPMSRLRARVAERLLQATQTTAMLTTFNEVNMQPIKSLRERHRDAFEKKHGVRLGYMSFFVRAAAEALKRHPEINASIDGDDIVYHGFCDIGVAISTDRGLVVPILRNAEYMSLAEIEAEILDFATRARDGKLTMEEITGGTFSITNGGVFGSMLSTPILNPPQSAILGMHSITDRPVVENGEVVVRPIMYLALTYDHRIVDGKSGVTFLKTIMELLEEPAAMLLDL
jgi:2-oxoglutarate dehydrogenase E2 component (dihydrolipoamide succinyltransferase)